MLTVLNPKEAYQGITVEHLGLIPSILREASEQIDIHSKETFLDAVEEAYGFPMYEMKGGTVENSTYKYPQDDDLEPIATYFCDGIEIHQYPYGIMAFMFSEPYITRMD